MSLTSWIDSVRRSWRRDRYRRSVVQARQTQASGVVEQLEDRTLLSSVVIESVDVGQSVVIDTQTMTGTGTLANPQFNTLAIRSTDVAPASGTAISIDLAGDDSSKLVLNAITIQSVIAAGNGAAGVVINLQDVNATLRAPESLCASSTCVRDDYHFSAGVAASPSAKTTLQRCVFTTFY